MSASISDSQSGNVISLAESIRCMPRGVRQHSVQHDRRGLSAQAGQCAEGARILDLSDRFPFYASVEVNDLPWVRAQFSSRSRDLVVASVKKILSQEFGRRRVRRTGYHFEIPHRKAEPLIAALLRVQFYTNQILLPEYNLLGERIEQNGISITWGVGRTLEQACQDRIRKRRARLPGAF